MVARSLLASVFIMLSGSSIGVSNKIPQSRGSLDIAPAIARREPHGESKLRRTPLLHHQWRRQKTRHQIGSSSSLIQKMRTFPAYQRNPQYIHPLGDAGQDLEKRAVKELNSTLVMAYLQSLINFPTRSYTNIEESQAVEDFLKNQFGDIGLTACFHTFKAPDAGPLTNVVSYIPGSTSDIVILGAHYDSRPYDGSAPGAEDNGSGVAALLAIARAFKVAGIRPKASIYFVAFAGEEPGLIGSEAFAQALQNGGSELPEECQASNTFLLNRGNGRAASLASSAKVIVMDEVGWASPDLETPTVNLESYDWTKPVMDHLRESSQTHNGESLRVVHSNHPFGSDHMSFLNNDIKAVLTINGNDEDYPNYHQSSDTIDNVDPHLLTMVSKMNLGALIRMAGIAS